MAIESGIAAVLSALTNGLREGLDRRSKKNLEDRIAKMEERKLTLMERELEIKALHGNEPDPIKALLAHATISAKNTEEQVRKMNLERGLEEDLRKLSKDRSELGKEIYRFESTVTRLKEKGENNKEYLIAKDRLSQMRSTMDTLDASENRTKMYLDAAQGRLRSNQNTVGSGLSEKELNVINQIYSFKDEASLADYYRKVAPTLSASARDKLKTESRMLIKNFRTTDVEQPTATPTEQEHVGPQQPGIPFGGQFEALGKGLKSLITPSRGQ